MNFHNNKREVVVLLGTLNPAIQLVRDARRDFGCGEVHHLLQQAFQPVGINVGQPEPAPPEFLKGVSDQIQRPLNLAMPQPPTDTFDCLGKEGAVLSILVGRARPAADGLGDVLNAHGEMEPILSCPRFFWTPICPTGGSYGEVWHEQDHAK